MRTATRFEKFGSALVYCHHSTVIAIGLFGMFEAPSPAVATVAGGTIAATLWSALFILFGVMALGCRLAERVGFRWKGELHKLDTTRSEAVAIGLIGFCFFLFGAFVGWSTLVTGTKGSIQTALALLSSSMFLPGVAAISLAMTRRARIVSRAQHTDVMRRVGDELRRDPGGTG